MQNQNINGISPSAVTPQINYESVIQQLEQAIASDVEKVQALTSQGVISNTQSQYLMMQLANKVKAIREVMQNVPVNKPSEEPAVQQNPFDLFNNEKPGFFDGDGRNAVLTYLRGYDVDKDEISKVAALVETVEKSAIDSYLKKAAHDKSLNDENLAAKSKLNSYAQNAYPGNDIGRIYTRVDLGNMSGDEFAKNEKVIFEQAKQGLIK